MSVKVLIVEDEYVVAKDLQLILEKAGYRVNGIAVSAEEAEEHLQKHKADLVLLDIRLKGMLSGIDLARKLRAENIAFVYLSANSSQSILEEAKATEPYGFLVKPFRKKDLLVMLDVAWYRHTHSLESKLRAEEYLRRRLEELSNEASSAEQTLLKIARIIQSYIPFDLIASGYRPLSPTPFVDTAYLRIEYDEFQFIGKKELMTITGLKESVLTGRMIEISDTVSGAFIYNEGRAHKKTRDVSLQEIFFDAFNFQSCLVVPLELSGGLLAHYFFYSRGSGIYSNNHIDLLNRLKIYLTRVTEKMIRGEASTAPAGSQSGHGDQKNKELVNRTKIKGIIGNHHLLLSALDLAMQVASYNTSVLILGETGTGKESVAQIIHSNSARKNGPFVKVNCAAIPSTLIESELFGHEKGAFTGAIEKKKGKFEQADGGTIFLDEIGELPLEMQVKLLRVLQEKEIDHVGGSSPMKVNVRIVAATNRNLEKEVAELRFRLDLYYRLNVFPITVPPLRDRKSDISALALFFAEKFCKEFNKPFAGISASMMDELFAYNWPGNIRELENVLEQCVILHDGKSKLALKRNLTSIPTDRATRSNANTLEDVKQIQRETEREYLMSVLKKTKGRIRGTNGAAVLLNIKPTTLESKMAKLNIRREEFIDETKK